MAEALTRAGRDPARLGRDDETLRRVGAFVELHVEQGRGLAELDRAGRRRHGDLAARPLAGRASGRGQPRRHHPAGRPARPDDRLRRPPCSPPAAAATWHGALATVGKVDVEPNGVNAIPSRVTPGWTPARPDAAAARAVVGGGGRRVEAHGRHGHRGVVDATGRAFDAGAGAPGWPALLGDAPRAAHRRRPRRRGPRRAGVPTAMLFVRNPTGVSHAPAEHAERRRLPGRRRRAGRRRWPSWRGAEPVTGSTVTQFWAGARPGCRRGPGART